MTIKKIIICLFFSLLSFQVAAQISTAVSGYVSSGSYETYEKPAVFSSPFSGSPTLSVDLSGALFILEITYSGDTVPSSTDDSSFAQWSGELATDYYVYSPENSSELLYSGQLSATNGFTELLAAQTVEIETPGETPTISVEIQGTDTISWLLNESAGSASIFFEDETNVMVNDVFTYPTAPSIYTYSSISLLAEGTDDASGDDFRLSIAGAEINVVTGDLDGDGIPDDEDSFPLDPLESSDTDGDGIGDLEDLFEDDPLRWSDDDGDGFSDQIIPPSELPEDAFPGDSLRWLDDDGDGASENDITPDDGIDNMEDAFPNDPLRWSDLDGDGYSDQIIPPSELPEDLLPNDPGEWMDSDLDGYGDDYDKCDVSITDPDAEITVDLEGLDIDLTNRYLTKGCWMADAVEILVNRAERGNSGVALATNYLVQSGEITGQQKGQIVSKAARKIEERKNNNNGKGNDEKNDNGNGKPDGVGNGNTGGNNGQGQNNNNKDNGSNGQGQDNSNKDNGSNDQGQDNSNKDNGSNDQGQDNKNEKSSDTPPENPPVDNPPPSDPPAEGPPADEPPEGTPACEMPGEDNEDTVPADEETGQGKGNSSSKGNGGSNGGNGNGNGKNNNENATDDEADDTSPCLEDATTEDNGEGDTSA